MNKNLRNKHPNLNVLFLLLCGGFLVIIGRLFFLQIIEAEDLSIRERDQLIYNQVTKNPRGPIYDRDGEELAVSIITGSLYVDPKEMRDGPDGSQTKPPADIQRKAAKLLAPVLKISEESLYQDFSLEGRFVWIKRVLDPKEYEEVKKIIKDNKLPGLHFLNASKRYYTKNRVAAQVLGFVNVDDEGSSGIEMMLNDELKSAPSKRTIFVDSQGREIADKSYMDPVKAQLPEVYLTIDSKIQYVLEEAMDRAIEKTHAEGAAAIIMDPYTGEILGMTSRPTFDPNNPGAYPPICWNNKAVSMIYEPGSVFKPIVGCMGLTEGVITPDTLIQDNGSIKIADRVIHNWDGEGMGLVPFSDVIKFSINTGMVQLGMKLGGERMTDYSKRFGFGSETGIELPGEECGILYNPKDMWEPDVATMAIGQGIAVTPLQELRAICAIANGGELLKPYIVKKVVAADGTVLREGKKQVIRNVITPQVAAQMRSMMEAVVASGGGKSAGIKGYRIAGKTGTAEKLADGGGYAAGKYIASFVGFVPADKPKYAMLVMLDTPKGVFYGSQVSAPVFKDTLQQVLVAKGIQPASSEGLPSFDELGKNCKVSQNGDCLPKMQILPNGKIKLPDFKGIDMRYAAELIQQGHLRLKPYGSGKAVSQKPAPGTEVDEGIAVEIWFK